MHWINPAGKSKVHSLVDKVYRRKNLEVAWENVKRNWGTGAVESEPNIWSGLILPTPQRCHQRGEGTRIGIRLLP